MLSSDHPRRVHRVLRRFGHCSKAIGMLSGLQSFSQPFPLLDNNALANFSVPSPSQTENVSSSQSLSPKLLYSFTCCSCKLHERLATVKFRNFFSFFILGTSICLVIRRSSLEAIGLVTNAQVSTILRSLSKLILISPTRHLLNICKNWNWSHSSFVVFPKKQELFSQIH